MSENEIKLLVKILNEANVKGYETKIFMSLCEKLNNIISKDNDNVHGDKE